jgi:hypothetical protein
MPPLPPSDVRLLQRQELDPVVSTASARGRGRRPGGRGSTTRMSLAEVRGPPGRRAAAAPPYKRTSAVDGARIMQWRSAGALGPRAFLLWSSIDRAPPNPARFFGELGQVRVTPIRPLRLSGVGSGSVVPLDGDRLARWARAGGGRLGSGPVTRCECIVGLRSAAAATPIAPPSVVYRVSDVGARLRLVWAASAEYLLLLLRWDRVRSARVVAGREAPTEPFRVVCAVRPEGEGGTHD